MKEKKKQKSLDSLAQQQSTDYKKQKSQTLILTIMLILGGSLAILSAIAVAGSPTRGPLTGNMVSVTMLIGIIGLLSGFYLLYRYKKLRRMEEQEKK